MQQTKLTPENESALTEFSASCEKFGADDFLLGESCYELLNGFTARFPEKQAQLEDIFARRAKACGISLNTVRGAIRQHRKLIPISGSVSSVTAWEGQALSLDAASYVIDGDRISEQRGSYVEHVCDHPIMPVRRYVDIESGEESMEIAYKLDGKWKSEVFDKGTLLSANTITVLGKYGIDVTSESAKALVRFLNCLDKRNRAVIPVSRMSTHVGWIGENEFVPYAEGVGYGGAESFRQMYDTIGEKGSEDKWLECVKAIRREKNSVPARMALAASFASPLMSKFNALPFIFHIWSPVSGTGKTVTLEVAASVWAKPGVGDYVRTLKATTVAVEQLAVFVKHMPLCLDELQTIQNQEKFDELIYMLCEGSGKSRGARNGGLRESPKWCNVTITSGEMPIIGQSSKAGSVNRVIEVESRGALMEKPRQAHLAISANYGFAGKRFIRELKSINKALEAKLMLLEDELRGKCTDKQALSAAMLLLGDWAAEKLIFKDGISLGVSDILPFLKTDADVDTNVRAHDWLISWISENQSGFALDGKSEQGLKLLGRIDTTPDEGREVWITVKAFGEAMKSAGFNVKSYKSWAQAKGILIIARGESTPNKMLPNGSSPRCVGIRIAPNKPEEMRVVHDAECPF